jgi:hypothetical protein
VDPPVLEPVVVSPPSDSAGPEVGASVLLLSAVEGMVSPAPLVVSVELDEPPSVSPSVPEGASVLNAPVVSSASAPAHPHTSTANMAQLALIDSLSISGAL